MPSGSVYGLIGPNGAGKTTAIRHMMGVLRQDAGSVLLDGEPVFENPSVKARMLCIPDEPYFTSTSTTRDLMKFTRALYPRFDTERYEKLREIFALDDTRPIRRLSRAFRRLSNEIRLHARFRPRKRVRGLHGAKLPAGFPGAFFLALGSPENQGDQNDGNNYDGYQDLKRLHDVSPREEKKQAACFGRAALGRSFYRSEAYSSREK